MHNLNTKRTKKCPNSQKLDVGQQIFLEFGRLFLWVLCLSWFCDIRFLKFMIKISICFQEVFVGLMSLILFVSSDINLS